VKKRTYLILSSQSIVSSGGVAAFVVSSISLGNSDNGQGGCTGGAEAGGGGGSEGADRDACAAGGSTDIREDAIDEEGSCGVDEVVGRGRSLQVVQSFDQAMVVLQTNQLVLNLKNWPKQVFLNQYQRQRWNASERLVPKVAV